MKSVDEIIKTVEQNYTQYPKDVLVLVSHIYTLRQRLAEAEAKVPKWLPIESAPKDGTKILGFSYDKYHHNWPAYYGVAEWATKKDYLLNSVAGWFWPYATRPTHWQPLPLPPEGDKAL